MAFTRKEKVGKGGSNLSFSITNTKLEEALKIIRREANLTSVDIGELRAEWADLQEGVKLGALTQKEAFNELKTDIKNYYSIDLENVIKKIDEQKEKLKDVEKQSKESIKEEIKDQKELSYAIADTNERFQEQAYILNQFRDRTKNQMFTPKSLDVFLTRLGDELGKNKDWRMTPNQLLNEILYQGYYEKGPVIKDNRGKPITDKNGKTRRQSLESFYKGLGLSDTGGFTGNWGYGKFLQKGLRDPNFLFNDNLQDILAIALLDTDEFDNYANAVYGNNKKDFDRLYNIRDDVYGLIWGGKYHKGKTKDENYFINADKRRKEFLLKNGLSDIHGSFGMPSGMRRAFQAFYLQQELENRPPRNMNNPVPLYPMEHYLKSNVIGNNIIDAEYRPVGQVAEQAYNRVSEDINIINQTTQKTASEINSNILQSEYSFNGMRQALSHWGSYTVATINKISKDMALTFRDFGNSVRTMSSVMYSAIHLAQALENVMNISDSMTAIAYRLERYDVTGASRDTLLKRAFNQANNSRSDIDSYATLSQRILATGVTNGNADEAMRIASLITKSMVLGGSTAQEQKSAQLQLSQALASNILGGDELRAIRENAIGFTEMLAKGLTRGYEQGIFTDPNFANVKIGDLKGLGKKQLLTADVVTKAIGLMEDEINKDFSTMPELFSQTMAKLMNTFKQRLNEFNQEGKGLSRIVKLFQDLEKWLNSDKGKQVLDKLMTILDSFISFLENIATKLGWILDKFGGPLTAILQLYFAIKPFLMASNVLFGKVDMYGNQRGGLIGYGGLGNILTRFTQGSGLLPSLFSAENVNGTTVAMGGLFPNLFSFGFDLFKKISGSNAGDNFANTILVQTYLNKLLKQDNLKNARSIYQATKAILGGDDISHANQMLLYQIFARNRNSKNWQIEGLINPSDVATSLLAFDKNGNNVFNNLAANAAGAGVGNALGNPVANAFAAKGGIIGKALGSSAAGPIALAIAAVVGGVLIRNHFDRKTDERQLDEFMSKLPNLDHLTGLQDEDRTALRDRAMSWYKSHTSGAFIGTKENWTEGEYSSFIKDYYNEAIERHEKYFANITKNTEATAANTAGTLDITDEFIRNMNDIRTRSIRGELLMNGNGINNSWNVVIHNESDMNDLVDRLQKGFDEAVNGSMTTPVLVQ